MCKRVGKAAPLAEFLCTAAVEKLHGFEQGKNRIFGFFGSAQILPVEFTGRLWKYFLIL